MGVPSVVADGEYIGGLFDRRDKLPRVLTVDLAPSPPISSISIPPHCFD